LRMSFACSPCTSLALRESCVSAGAERADARRGVPEGEAVGALEAVRCPHLANGPDDGRVSDGLERQACRTTHCWNCDMRGR